MKILNGNCNDELKPYVDYFDACVTDAPYGLSFMGKKWDYDVPSVDTFKSILNSLKPGAYLLCFAGSRTQHRMCVNIEDAGFEIRDTIMWIYGSGFPKGLNIAKGLDALIKTGKSNPVSLKKVEQEHGGEAYKLKGKNNGIMGETVTWDRKKYDPSNYDDKAIEYEGYNTNLKPAYEPIIMARKPFKGSVTKNILKHGTGGINIDACRVGDDGGTAAVIEDEYRNNRETGKPIFSDGHMKKTIEIKDINKGRYPANIILDELAGDELGDNKRFFYCPKVSKKERNKGLEAFKDKAPTYGDDGGTYQGLSNSKKPVKNDHPTVKPIALMKYLIKLVMPPKSTNPILVDPFMGSGSTLVASKELGYKCVGIELDKEYCKIAEERIK